MSDIVLTQIILPPTEETCYAGHCSQKSCCDVSVRADEQDPENDPGEEDVYMFSMCAAHALWLLHGALEIAVDRFPPDEPIDPPWERGE